MLVALEPSQRFSFALGESLKELERRCSCDSYIHGKYAAVREVTFRIIGDCKQGATGIPQNFDVSVVVKQLAACV